MPQQIRFTILIAALAILPLTASGGPLDESCIVGNRPAATLLFPYFEVDLDDPAGRTTVISLNNLADGPSLARVVMWTDCHLPILSFDVFLEPNDVAPINLRSILTTGNLPVTTPGPDGLAAFPSCSDPITNPNLDGAARANLQAQLTGQPSPADGMCYGSERADNRIAVGFLTVDALNDCSQNIRFPDDPGYFVAGGNGLASNDNVLWGDYSLINPAENFAQGFEAIAVVADPDRFVDNNIRSFYQVTEDERDDRVPISSQMRARFLNGGVFDGSTQLTVWVQRSPDLLPFVCGSEDGACPAAEDLALRFKIYDEQAQETLNQLVVPPAFLSRIDIEDLTTTTDFGFLDLESTALSPVGPPGFFEQRQAWLLQTSSASGRFSVGLGATRLNDLCQEASQGE